MVMSSRVADGSAAVVPATPAGGPVVVQDTGWSEHLPSGEGVLAFPAPEEAARDRSCFQKLSASLRCRPFSKTHFDAAKVCADLLE